MRIFKSKWFNKWAEKEKLTDIALKKVIKEIEGGLIDADLGGHIYKKRAAIEGLGKSGGLRTIIAFKIDSNAFFIFGFPKNKRANISDKELKSLKLMAKELLSYNDLTLKKALIAGSLIEVENDE